MTEQQIQLVHDSSLAVLARIGVAFHSAEVVEFFKARGFKTEGRSVFFTEDQVQGTLETAPSGFTVTARNPEASLTLGQGGLPAMAPGYGAPFILEGDGHRRPAELADYHDFCKLVQTSKVLNTTGFLMGDPHDLDPAVYHLDMLLASLTLTNKPFMASPLSGRSAGDSVEMAEVIFGPEPGPVMFGLISALSPLQYAGDMAEALLVLARAGQPVIITGSGIRGSTVPISLSGALVLENALALAGLVLAQQARPGAPVIFGLAGSPLDMRTGAYYIGSPEGNLNTRLGSEMARFYGLPFRGGGALTDAHAVDYQAGFQSALALSAPFYAGVDFILAACGIMSSFMAMSFEKFVLDEDVCRHVLKVQSEPEIRAEEIDLEAMAQVGSHGQYLTRRDTFERCRTEFVALDLANRQPFDKWRTEQPRELTAKAARAVAARLAAFQKPDLDPALVRDLTAVVKRKKEAR